MVPIHQLLPADSPRLAGENGEHATMLAELDQPLPSIVVHRPSMRVIDGMHRLRAAVLRGQDHIEVTFFDGDEAAAFLLAVSLNVTHGLPLSLGDRRAAATRIMALRPQMSDRAISRAAGLSPKTVGALRRSEEEDGLSGQDSRVGRDGRLRPLNSAQGRRVASALFAERPDASLRDIARSAGISPATARDVRVRLSRDEDPVPPRLREAEKGRQQEPGMVPPSLVTDRRPTAVPGRRRDPRSALVTLRNDPALRFRESGRALLTWLTTHIVDAGESEKLAAVVPGYASDLVAQLARDCAVEWISLANRLQNAALDPPEDAASDIPAAREVI